MTAILVALSVAVILLAVLVAGLLRAYADVLQRLDALTAVARKTEKSKGDRLAPGLVRPPERELERAPDIAGTSLAGAGLRLTMGGGGPHTLLAFLSSGCATCEAFWSALNDEESRQQLPADVQVVAVTKSSDEESPSKLLALAGTTPVVLSSAAWTDYDVPGAPYFVFVDGQTGDVRGDGAAVSFNQVVSLLRDAVYDAELERGGTAATAVVDARVESNLEREMRAYAALEAAGIGPDDPSLFDDTSWTATGVDRREP